jgi:hypothetical protein
MRKHFRTHTQKFARLTNSKQFMNEEKRKSCLWIEILEYDYEEAAKPAPASAKKV